jgi:hypothetical protein
MIIGIIMTSYQFPNGVKGVTLGEPEGTGKEAVVSHFNPPHWYSNLV